MTHYKREREREREREIYAFRKLLAIIDALGKQDRIKRFNLNWIRNQLGARALLTSMLKEEAEKFWSQSELEAAVKTLALCRCRWVAFRQQVMSRKCVRAPTSWCSAAARRLVFYFGGFNGRATTVCGIFQSSSLAGGKKHDRKEKQERRVFFF